MARDCYVQWLTSYWRLRPKVLVSNRQPSHTLVLTTHILPVVHSAPIPDPVYTKHTISPPHLPTLRPSHRVANPLHLDGAVSQLRDLTQRGLKSFEIKIFTHRTCPLPDRTTSNVSDLALQALDVSEHESRQGV